MSGLLRALQARKIDRVAAVYVVTGWVLVQGASIALPAFGAPQWALRVFIALAIVGLPVTLAIAWVAAPHPHGKRGRPPPAALHTDIALLTTLGIVFVAILGQLAYFVLWPVAQAPRERLAQTENISAPRAGGMTSIAVLPFASMSSDPSNVFFSDGISAELIAELSHVPELKVAARASSFSFEKKGADIKTIAKALGVHSVLDGSVRVEGTRVRIEAELSSDDGFTIWSQAYDGDLTHILDLQDEIARAITAALTHRLLGKGDLSGARPATMDPDAYRQYLEARYDFAQRTEASVNKAIALLRQVTKLQPDFADGFAALALAESTSVFNFGHREYIPAANEAVLAARRLDPANTEAVRAHVALSLASWDWPSATADLRLLLAQSGSSAESLNSEALLFKYLGFPVRSLAAARASAKLNPLFPVAWANIASSLFELGRYDEASAAAANGLALLPDQPDILVEQCGAFAHTGRMPAAQAIADTLTKSGEGRHADGCLFEIALVSGTKADARKIADRIAHASGAGAARLRETLGQYYLLAGDTKAALFYFEQAYAAKELGLFTVREDHSTPASLFQEPAWKALWQRPLMKEWQAAHDSIAASLKPEN